MTTIKGTSVTMTKGDTVILAIGIVDTDGTPYVPRDGDSVRFALKKSYDSSTPLILKQIPLDTMELRIEPEETKKLDSGPARGKYVYDIELTKADGTVDTFIPRAEWLILEEVY